MNCSFSINKIYNNNQKLFDIICTLSALILTTILSLNYSVLITYVNYTADSYIVKPKYVFIAVCIAIPVYIYFINKKRAVKNVIENISDKTLYISVFFTISIVYKLISDTMRNYTHIKASSLGKILSLDIIDRYHNMWIVAGCALCGIALFVVIAFLCSVARDIIFDCLLPTETSEKKYIFITLCICTFVILYFYQRATGQWNSLDLVYQTDTIFLYEHYYPVFSYGYDYDWDIGNGGIRHPLATLVTYPIYIVVYILSNVLFFIPNITAILYAVSNAFLLILTVVMLVRITNNKWLYIIFSLSYPFTFYVVFLEKYQLAVFFSVLFLYLVKKKADTRLQGTALIAAGGIMITSAFCGFAYGNSTNIKERIKEYISIFVTFLMTLILTGRISYILNFGYLKNHNYEMFFNSEKAPFVENLFKYSHTIVACFVPVPYEATDKNFYWSNHKTNFNWICILILILIIIAFIKHRKRIEVKVFMLWILWSVLQMLLGSSLPLFNLYFAWAVIPMALLGMETLIKNKKAINTAYVILAMIMFFSNFIHMKDVLDYLILKTPV